MTLQLPELPEDQQWYISVRDKLVERSVFVNGVQRPRLYAVVDINVVDHSPRRLLPRFLEATSIEVPFDASDTTVARSIEAAARELMTGQVDQRLAVEGLRERISAMTGANT